MTDEVRQGQKRKRRSKRRRLAPIGRLETALRELSQALQEVAHRDGLTPPDQLEMIVELQPTDGRGWKRRVQDCLDALSKADRNQPKIEPHPAGHVWCFQCARIDCSHSRALDERDVFAGYHATGKPNWVGFLDLCIQQKKRQVNRLFGDRRGVVALAHGGEELNAAMLHEFSAAAHGFEVMGQAVIGLIPKSLTFRKSPNDGFVLSIQVVKMRETKPRLQLRILGIGEHEIITAAVAHSPRSPAEQLRRTLERTRRRLASLERKVYRGASLLDHSYLLDEVGRIVNRVRSDLARIFNPRGDRTAHGRTRHQGMERPTASARDDARTVSKDRVLADTRKETFVVLGPKKRAHIFSPEGLHVTSLRLEPGELERKTARKRWRHITPEELLHFRTAIARSQNPDELDGLQVEHL